MFLLSPGSKVAWAWEGLTLPRSRNLSLPPDPRTWGYLPGLQESCALPITRAEGCSWCEGRAGKRVEFRAYAPPLWGFRAPHLASASRSTQWGPLERACSPQQTCVSGALRSQQGPHAACNDSLKRYWSCYPLGLWSPLFPELCRSRSIPGVPLQGLVHFVVQSLVGLVTSGPWRPRERCFVVMRFSLIVKTITALSCSFLHVPQKQNATNDFWYFCTLSTLNPFFFFSFFCLYV